MSAKVVRMRRLCLSWAHRVPRKTRDRQQGPRCQVLRQNRAVEGMTHFPLFLTLDRVWGNSLDSDFHLHRMRTLEEWFRSRILHDQSIRLDTVNQNRQTVRMNAFFQTTTKSNPRLLPTVARWGQIEARRGQRSSLPSIKRIVWPSNWQTCSFEPRREMTSLP